MSGDKKSAKLRIKDMLADAGEDTLQGTEEIVAVAILYEGGLFDPQQAVVIPSGGGTTGLSPGGQLARILVEQYKKPGWIPANLTVGPGTTVVERKLIYGEEISENAGLDTAGSNAALATMLAEEVDNVDGCSAIAFIGDSPALGQTFFAVLAR